MKIIGINNEMYISSACLIEDGKIIAAVAEERLSRDKLTRAFPQKAIDYCLKEAGIEMKDVDFIASSWNPGVYLEKYNPLYSGKRRNHLEQLYSVPDNVMHFYDRPSVDYVKQEIGGDFGECNIYYVTHHRAHAANGFFLSPFESAAILTADAQGEFESVTYCHGKGKQIEHIKSINYPHSLGALYATFTEHLGFRSNSDEWKVMAMASFADGNNEFYDLIKENVVRFSEEGTFELNLSFFKGYLHEQPSIYTDLFLKVFGPARKRDSEITEKHYKIAAALQKISEELAVYMLTWLHEKTGEDNVVLSGGFFMNSVFNGRVLELTPFKKVFISSCPDDSGNCFGAALYLYNHILGNERIEPMTHNYYGPEYNNKQIEEALRGYNLKYEISDDIASDGAKLIADGNVVGWFQGRMEFGQRALGARSILADPRRKDMQEKVNLAVKFREGFRPFAPAVIEERQKEFFEMGDGGDVPFMEKVYPVAKEKRDLIPAVVHVDGSGRMQTVYKKTNPVYHSLIKKFGEITDIPVVLNTSFNLNGEPVVSSPKDAIRTFYSCGLDVLIIGDFIVRKEGEKA